MRIITTNIPRLANDSILLELQLELNHSDMELLQYFVGSHKTKITISSLSANKGSYKTNFPVLKSKERIVDKVELKINIDPSIINYTEIELGSGPTIFLSDRFFFEGEASRGDKFRAAFLLFEDHIKRVMNSLSGERKLTGDLDNTGWKRVRNIDYSGNE